MSTTSRQRVNSLASNPPELEEEPCPAKLTQHRLGRTSKSRRTTPIENGLSGSCYGCANWRCVWGGKRRNRIRQNLHELVRTLRSSPRPSLLLDLWILEDEP